jgi:cold shock protein
MLEAIKKFVLERRRDLRQSRRLVVEEDGSDDAPSNSDVPPRLVEPELKESSGGPARGKVKWFNPNKGYGFVQLSDGTGDVFLHATALVGIRGSAVSRLGLLWT